MRVVHEPEEVVGEADSTGDATTLATNVEFAESSAAHAMGLRFRRSLPEDYAFVMHVASANPLPLFGGPSRNIVDMFFMRVPLDLVWLLDEEVVKVKRMHPWRSFGIAKADTIVEFPAGAAEDVAVGDTVRIVDDE